jgi:hypothetical protein
MAILGRALESHDMTMELHSVTLNALDNAFGRPDGTR